MTTISVMHDYHVQVAQTLQPVFGFMPTVDDGWGIKVKGTPHADYYLQKMLLVNWRLIEVPAGSKWTSSRGWCYSGETPQQALLVAVANVLDWSGEQGTEPSGWLKSVPDGRHGPGKYGWDAEE